MKNWRCISILGILVSLAACTKVENVYVPETISYSVGTYASATKAVQVTEFNSFRSKAWMHTVENPGGSLFFDETILFDGSASQWYPSHDYYWPKHSESYLNFVSWYDKNGEPAVTENSIDWTSRTIVADDNLLVAQKAWNQKANSQTYYYNGVPTLFRHVLSQVEFKVMSSPTIEQDGNVTTTWSTELSNFVLSGVCHTGSLSLSSAASAPAAAPFITAWDGEWVVNAGSAANISVAASQPLDTTPFSVIPARSVLPQSIDGIAVSFHYVIVTTSTNGTDTHVLREEMDTGNLLLSSFTGYNGDWEMNKKITYTISVTAKSGAIAITPTITTIESDHSLNVE